MQSRLTSPTLGVIGLAAILVAGASCGGDGGTNVPEPVIGSVARQAATNGQSATVGTAVLNAPAVIVRDQNGQPMEGVTVTFALVSGGGSLSGATQTTGEDGVAAVAAWTLGHTTGQNELSATVSGFDPLIFTATGTADVPASVTKVEGTDAQTAAAGETVANPPALIVYDQYLNPVPGVAVAFEVASGGGGITGASQTTDASGMASVGSWTLGTTNDPNALHATVGTLTPTVFTATVDPCTVVTALTLDGAADGVLTSADCRGPLGHFKEIYGVTLVDAGAVEFNLTSAAFDTFFELYDASGGTIAFNDDGLSGTSSMMRMLMPAGDYLPTASSYATGAEGDFTISAASIPASIDGCFWWWAMPGITSSQSLATTDCTTVDAGSTWYSDMIAIHLEQGQTVRITMTSVDLNAHLVLYDVDLNQLAEDDDGAGGMDARITYTAAVAGLYHVKLGAYTAQTGAYTLEIQ